MSNQMMTSHQPIPGRRAIAVGQTRKGADTIRGLRGRVIALSGAAALAIAGLGAGIDPARSQATDAGIDTFNLPEDISFLTKASPNLRRPTARVNGSVITGTEVDHRVALILSTHEGTVPEEEMQRLRLQVLRNLIDETLQVQEASSLDMKVERAEIDASFERYAREGRGQSPEELEKHLATIGSSARTIKRQLEGELAWERLLRRNVAPFVNVSETEVSELFERMQASRGTAEYRLGEIFLQSTPATRQAVATNSRQIVNQIREGGSFATYASQYSQASTAAVGGDLGWIRPEQLQNPQLETIVRDMLPGQLVGPVEIAGGFWIGLLIDKRQIGMPDPRDAVLSLKQVSIEFPTGTTAQDAEKRGTAFIEGVKQLNGCGDADAKAAALGATVVHNDGISARALPEALQSILLGLNVGQATPPFGDLRDGIRVLILCGRDDPADTSGPNMRDLMAQLEDERINRRAQRYLRDLRRDAVIEYN